MSGELQRLGQSLLDLIHEISTIGEFRSVVKKDCQGLKGWVGLLSHLFEEIRDFGNGDGSGGSLFQECVSCLGELLLALEGAKRVLELGRSGSDVFLGKAAKIWRLALLATFWKILRCRNKLVFEQEKREPSQASNSIRRDISCWATSLRSSTY